MNRGQFIYFAFALCAALLFGHQPLHAQFRGEAFTQQYNDHPDSLATADTSDMVVNFKEIFGGLAHKRPMRIGSMFGTSVILPGTAQIYNQQYWKLPIVYGGIGAGIACGVIYNQRYQKSGLQSDKNASLWSFIGAGAVYYASLMDGVISYKSDRKPHPGRATVYSILLPGLGQAYNGEFWKIPIYDGGIAVSVHFLLTNQKNYERFRDTYRESVLEGYSGPISGEQAKYYRNLYRRYRDYSIVAIAAVYLLQVIDANVFCYMNDFEVSDNLSMNISPTVILPDNSAYAFNPKPATGVSFGLRF